MKIGRSGGHPVVVKLIGLLFIAASIANAMPALAVSEDAYKTATIVMAAPLGICGIAFLAGRTIIPPSKIEYGSGRSLTGIVATAAVCIGIHTMIQGAMVEATL